MRDEAIANVATETDIVFKETISSILAIDNPIKKTTINWIAE